MSRSVLMSLVACAVLVAPIAWGQAGQAKSETQKTYVGSEKCQSCHEKEYDRFRKYSRKTQSFDHIALMKKGLTEEEYRNCMECHTTGFGKPGGFSSEKETPLLKEVGCEACHGPGSLHVESSDRKDIKNDVSEQDCAVCHNKERVEAFRFKPLIYGGAH
ncbi:Cytochrome c family protein [Syntrophobacter sp. SbD1]|nr:Cytochrome c family protein [Syntrophobacter sp. SbD1]